MINYSRSKMSPYENTSVVDLTALTYSVEFYSILTIINVGLVANLVNILVCTRKELQKNTMGFYNILMSIFNILTLVSVGYVNLFPQTIGKTPLVLHSTYSCMLILYFNRVFCDMATWIYVMVTLDRMLCVSSVSRFKYIIKDKRKLALVVLGLFLAIAVANAPNFLFSLATELKYDPHSNLTTTLTECKASTQVTLIRDSITSMLRVLLPLVLQLVFNSVLVYKLVKNRRISVSMSRLVNTEYRFAFTIIVLNVIVFASDLPLFVCFVLINVYGYNQTYISRTSNESAWASFAFVCSLVLSSFVYVSLFFVNYATNKIFRRESKNIYFGK